MSGHSKWSTIKRAKGVKDVARGKLFSKLSRVITIAVKEGGGPDIDANYKLRIAVDNARAANMPNENIKRAIHKGSGESSNLTEVLYEGFGPEGVGVLIEVTTDNKNRTAQLIKSTLEKHGGLLAGPNSVSFNFETRGFLELVKNDPDDDQVLTLIDSGVEEYQEHENSLEVYIEPSKLFSTKKALEEKGMKVLDARLIKKPINFVEISDKGSIKLIELIDVLEELDDVEAVFVNSK